MPLIYCPICGNKHSFTGLKPKTCQACDESLEPKRLAPKRAARAYEEPEEEVEAESSFDIEALRRSVRLVSEGTESLMTMAQLGKMPDSLGNRPTIGSNLPAEARAGLEAVRDEVLNKMLGKGGAQPSFTPPPEMRGNARKTGKLTR